MLLTVALLLVSVAVITADMPGVPVFEFYSSCDDIHQIYGDGKQEGFNDRWKATQKSTLRTMIKTIAVACKNKGGPAGFLGSTPDGRILTNSTWKCSTTYEEGWNKYGFNDSHWAPGIIIDNNISPVTHGWKARPLISQNALWIGAAKELPKNATSYCRLDLVFDFVMICDDNATLYADGIEIGRQKGFITVSKPMPIPKMATTFAVACTNKGAFGGLLGSTIDGRLITDPSWKVNGEYIDGWYNPTFDDSTWKGASIIDNNIKPTTHGWRVQKTVSRDAVWIGNDTVWRTEAVYTTQYFRRKIGCLWKSSCRKSDNDV